MLLKKQIEETILCAQPIKPLPSKQWNQARGLWVAESSQGELFPYVPEAPEEFDIVWISENPGEWRESNRPNLYSTHRFDWKEWNKHYSLNFNIPYWKSIRKALTLISKNRRIKVLFSNAYLFEWPSEKKFNQAEVSDWFVENQAKIYISLIESGAISARSQICLCGQYAQTAWYHFCNNYTRASAYKSLPLGHPSHGHLAKSLKLLFP